MARLRKNEEPAPPSQDVHLRLPLSVLNVLDELATKKKQSRNVVVVSLLTKATTPKAKKEAK
jgi:hypothetical protein